MNHQHEEAKLSAEEIAEIHRNMEARGLTNIFWQSAEKVAVTSFPFPLVEEVEEAGSPYPQALWEAEVRAAYSPLPVVGCRELRQLAYPSLILWTSLLPPFRNIKRHKVRYRDHSEYKQ
jgi:hypothetical protein